VARAALPSRPYGARGVNALQIPLELVLLCFCGWTLAYQLVYVARLPAWVTLPLTVVFLCGLVAPYLRSWGRCGKSEEAGNERSAFAVVLALAIAVAVFSLFLCRPDADDISYLHRSLVQAWTLGDPIIIADTVTDVRGLPGLGAGYLLTSYEFLTTMVARALGLHPLTVYHNLACALASFFVPVVYYVLLREIGLSRWYAVVGVLGVLFFLILDGGDHRSLGNFSFVRLWQGKAVLMTVGLPLALLYVLQYVRRQVRGTLVMLTALQVGATGVTTIGCFFLPLYVLMVSLAVVGVRIVLRESTLTDSLRRLAFVNLPSLYGLLVVAAIFAGWLPTRATESDMRVARMRVQQYSDLSVMSGSWWPEIVSVASGWYRLLWWVVVLGAAPFLALLRRNALYVAALAPAFLVLIANPLSGSMLKGLVPDVYWRFAFYLPVPLCVGLLLAGMTQAVAHVAASCGRTPSCSDTGRRARASSVARILCVVGLLIALVLTTSSTTISPGNEGFTWKRPGAFKLDPGAVSFLAPALDCLAGRDVLAETEIVIPLALMERSTRFVAERAQNTILIFAAAGRLSEGSRRLQAQAVVVGSDLTESGRAALRDQLQRGVDAVIIRNCVYSTVMPVLEAAGDWRVGHRDPHRTVLIRQ